MFTVLDKLLNEALLGFLALLSLFLMFMPAVFELSPTATQWLALTEYGIVSLFAAEYFSAFVLSHDKTRFVLNRWRVLDLLIIGGALIALLPAMPDLLRNSPALRLLRLGRVALLGTRSGLALTTVSASAMPQGDLHDEKLVVLALKPSGSGFESVSWEAGLSRIGSEEPDWLFISGVTESRIAPIAAALGVPETAMRGLFQSSVPRFDRLERFTALFVRYPLPFGPDGRLRRTPVLLVGSDDNVVVLSRERTDLEARVEQRLAGNEGFSRMTGAAVALLGEIVRANTEAVERLEASLVELESRQVDLRDETFLARTFELRTDVLKVRGSLKHLRNVMHDISGRRLSVGLSDTRSREAFQLLADDAGDLYENVEDLRESLQALVDLRLNVASFQMNRVMRLLALLTALALIPATAGGLLGMNLLDTPWPATLAQVSFGVAAGMALSLYIFTIKGWLR